MCGLVSCSSKQDNVWFRGKSNNNYYNHFHYKLDYVELQIFAKQDKFIKVWDIRSKKCGISLNLTQKGEISDISSHQSTIWASASDCKVYEFDTRMIRQKKEISHFLECKDEISQIAYDNKCNSLFTH